MKELGVIFSGTSIPAILAGQKTATRRFRALGAPGDRLWVREAFGLQRGNGIRLVFRADGPPRDVVGFVIPASLIKWTSPLYCSRKISRITLELLTVRTEPLFAMTAEDFRAEGVVAGPIDEGPDASSKLVEWARANGLEPGPKGGLYWQTEDYLRARFAQRWDEMHAAKRSPPGRDWKSNPTVFVHTFRKVSPA